MVSNQERCSLRGGVSLGIGEGVCLAIGEVFTQERPGWGMGGVRIEKTSLLEKCPIRVSA